MSHCWNPMSRLIDVWALLGGHGTHHLYKANVPVLNHRVCEYLFDPTVIPDSMLCAGLKNGGVDSCQV